ncbi:hypothetical protein [Adlercreutzia sp. ZJ154]|uniref:hypothetical protein n=1 Tax=Adlercreutzia sp. ZJ154 TaxID=2709790 RepID=UPI0013EBE1F8|nr:hypothetical protein [Adlercreutzia sp. ZJ154]
MKTTAQQKSPQAALSLPLEASCTALPSAGSDRCTTFRHPKLRKAISATMAVVLAATMCPALAATTNAAAPDAAYAAEGEGGTTREITQISVTAPFEVNFGSAEKPIDVANQPATIETQSYFRNGGDLALSVNQIECEAAPWTDAANAVLTKTSGAPLENADKVFSVRQTANTTDAANSFGYGDTLGSGSITSTIGVNKGDSVDVTYSLNLGNTAKINPAAAKTTDRQSLGKVKFTFGIFAPKSSTEFAGITVPELSDENLWNSLEKRSELTNAGFYLIYGGCIYNAADVKAHAQDISKNGEASLYYGMYRDMINKDVSCMKTDGSVQRRNTYNAGYTCKVFWKTFLSNMPHTVTTNGVTSYWYDVRIIDILHDDKVDGTGKAGLTFQFVEAMEPCDLPPKDLGYKEYKHVWGYRYNAKPTYEGGWTRSELRSRMNPARFINAYHPIAISDDYTQDPQIGGYKWDFTTDANTNGNKLIDFTYSNSSAYSIWDRVPNSLQTQITPVLKSTALEADSSTSIVDSENCLFIASYVELYGMNRSTSESLHWLNKEGFRYDFYSKADSLGIGLSVSLPKPTTEGCHYHEGDWKDFADYYTRSVYSNGFPMLVTFAGSTMPENINAVFGRSLVPCFCF